MALIDLLKDKKGMTFGEALKGLVVIVVGVGVLAIVISAVNKYFGGGVEERNVYDGDRREVFIEKDIRYFGKIEGQLTLDYIESLKKEDLKKGQESEKSGRRPGYESPKPLR